MEIKKFCLDFCDLELHPKYLVLEVHQGVDLSKTQMEEILKLADEYYDGREYVHISHRKNDYSINPLIAKEMNLKSSMRKFAIVVYRDHTINNAKIEKAVYEIDLQLFSSLEDAKKWALED